MIVIAHNIRSLHNVGSIFRNAAAFGIEKLYLTGITASPPRKEIAKVALGAQDIVPWERGDIFEVIDVLHGNAFVVYGLENIPGAVRIDALENVAPLALVLGNEVEGIERDVVDRLDGLVTIPMGKKRSLNVSVASGIAMYELA